MNFNPLFAQEAAAPPAGETPGLTGATGDVAAGAKGATQVPFIMRPEVMIVIMVIMMAVMFMNSRKRNKELQARRAQMRAGSKITTTSGLVGRIVSIKDNEDEVVIKCEDTKLRILKGTIANVIDETVAAPATTEQKA